MKNFILLTLTIVFSGCYTVTPTNYIPRYYFNIEPVVPYYNPYYTSPYYVAPYYYRPNYFIIKPKPHHPRNNYHYGPRKGR